MSIRAEVRIDAPAGRVWRTLADPEGWLAAVGGLSLDAGESSASGAVKFRLGSRQIAYDVKASASDRDDEMWSVDLEVTGEESRGEGRVEAVLAVHVAEASRHSTIVVNATLSATGRGEVGDAEWTAALKDLLAPIGAAIEERAGRRGSGAAPVAETPAEPAAPVAKAAAKETAAKKAPPAKAVAKKAATATKATAKKTAAKAAAATKTSAKKTAAKATPAKKTSVKKAAKKATEATSAKEAATKATPAKKAAATGSSPAREPVQEPSAAQTASPSTDVVPAPRSPIAVAPAPASTPVRRKSPLPPQAVPALGLLALLLLLLRRRRTRS